VAKVGDRLLILASRVESADGPLSEPTRAAKRLESAGGPLFEPPRAAKRPVAKRLEPARGTPGLEGLESARLVHNTTPSPAHQFLQVPQVPLTQPHDTYTPQGPKSPPRRPRMQGRASPAIGANLREGPFHPDIFLICNSSNLLKNHEGSNISDIVEIWMADG